MVRLHNRKVRIELIDGKHINGVLSDWNESNIYIAQGSIPGYHNDAIACIIIPRTSIVYMYADDETDVTIS